MNNIGKEVKANAIEEGLFMRPLGNVIYLMPPLCITDNQLLRSYKVIEKVLNKYI